MKFLVADDHPLFREAIHNVLQLVEPEAVVLEAWDCDTARAQIAKNPDFDLVLLDLVMPCKGKMNCRFEGTDLLPKLLNEHPGLPVVILSASEDPADMRSSLDHGALGYIPKSLPTRVMTSALQLVLSGGIYVPTGLVDMEMAADTPESPSSGGIQLSPRQTDIARLLREGKSNKEIGRSLGLSPETVKVHITAIFRILGVNNRTRAVMELERIGWGS